MLFSSKEKMLSEAYRKVDGLRMYNTNWGHFLRVSLDSPLGFPVIFWVSRSLSNVSLLLLFMEYLKRENSATEVVFHDTVFVAIIHYLIHDTQQSYEKETEAHRSNLRVVYSLKTDESCLGGNTNSFLYNVDMLEEGIFSVIQDSRVGLPNS